MSNLSNKVPFDDFIEYCKGKTIAIVGPSESIKNNEDEIENHDIVVRLNDWHLLDEPKIFGRRTDVHCYNFWSPYPKLGGDKLNKIEWIMNSHPFEGKDIFVQNKRNYANNLKEYPSNKHTMFPDDYRKKIKSKTFPTSGAFVIFCFIDMLHQIEKLSVYGISLNLSKYHSMLYTKGKRLPNNDIIDHHDFRNDRKFIKETITNLPIELRDKLYIDNDALRDYIYTFER